MTLPTKKKTGNVNNNSSSCCREKACVSFGQKHKQDREVGIDCPRFGAAPQKRVVCRLLNNCPLPGNIQRVEICDAWPGTWQLLGLEPQFTDRDSYGLFSRFHSISPPHIFLLICTLHYSLHSYLCRTRRDVDLKVKLILNNFALVTLPLPWWWWCIYTR